MTEGERADQLPEFRWPFERSPYFQPFLDRVNGLLQTYTPHSGHDFLESFTGCLFEELSYVRLLKIMSEKVTFLSPHETIEYFHNIYPDIPLFQTRLQVSLDHRYVPDGLILKGDKVEKIVEYSSKGKDTALVDYMRKKVRSVRQLRRLHPALFSGAELVIMFTQDVHESLISRGLKPNGATLDPIPITHHHVHQYANQLARRHFPMAVHPHAPQA